MQRLSLVEERIAGNTQEFIYSVPIGPARKGETAIHRKPSHKDGLLKVPNHITSFGDLWKERVKQFANRPFIEDLTYKQVDEKARKAGSWIQDHGHKLFYLYCKNSPAWTIADIASWNYGFVNVPLYDTLGQEAFDYILDVTEGTLLFTTKDLIPTLIKNLNGKKYKLKTICFFDDINANDKILVEKLGFQVYSFTDVVNHTKINPRPKLSLDTEISYAFTSGTTGIPKGVVYTHRMGITQVLAMKGHLDYTENDVHMSFLPIAHTFERFVTWMVANSGGCIRYAKFPVTEIVKDLMTIKPTVIPLVPRLLNKFYPICKGIYEQESNYNKIRGMFGGRLRVFVTGSAPVAPSILLFFKEALNCDAREGYGQTETTAASFITYKDDVNFGHVGGPNSTTEFKLKDVPEMNYFSTDSPPRGEVCTRGESIFSTYFKDPKNTKETVDEEGWNHSGDIGMILPNGALKIIDRKKNIFKLQQGEYIAPEKIENVYARCKYVAESFLYGDSLKNYNVAIIHPNLELLPVVAKELGIKETDAQKLCENPKINQFILNEITKQAKQDGLHSFETAKKIRLWHHPFSLMGVVTSTMKLQRNQAKLVFNTHIDDMYKE